MGAGYSGPPELTWTRALTSWTFDPWALAVLVALCVLYLGGVRRVRRSGGEWPVGRVVAFCVGAVGLGVIATCSALAVYWPVLFYIRAIQTVLLLLAIPLFAAMGRPLSLIIEAGFGRRLQAAISSRAARALTFPAVTAFFLVATPFAMYFSPWYEAGFHSTAVRELTCLVLVLPGLLFFWTLLRVDPVPKAYPYLVSLWITVAEVVGDAVLGLAIIASKTLIAGSYYHALGRPWGPSLASDQVIGGGALWILGDIIGLPFLAAVLIAMIHEDESEAKVVDAALDAAEAAVAGAAAGVRPENPAAGAPSPPVSQPWWESDPRIVGRFQAAAPGSPPPGSSPADGEDGG